MPLIGLLSYAHAPMILTLAAMSFICCHLEVTFLVFNSAPRPTCISSFCPRSDIDPSGKKIHLEISTLGVEIGALLKRLGKCTAIHLLSWIGIVLGRQCLKRVLRVCPYSLGTLNTCLLTYVLTYLLILLLQLTTVTFQQ